MKKLSINKFIATLLIVTIISPSLFLPAEVRAASTVAKATADCTIVEKLSTTVSLTIAEWMTAAETAIGGNSISVPTQNPGSDTNTAQTASEQTGETTWTMMSDTLDCIAYKSAQIVLDNMTKTTVNWIKGGMNGSPYYAIDQRQFEQDLIGAVAGNFAAQIKGLELCEFDSMFKNDLANWLVVGSTGDSDLKLQRTIACPFKGINASDFYKGTQAFTWQYFETALNDSGNPFGVSVVAQSKYTEQQQAEAARAKQKLDWGSGFLSVVDTESCHWPDDMTEQAVMNGASYNDEGATLSEQEIAAYQRAYCDTTTPAQLIESRLTKATDTEWDRIGFADSFNKVIKALVENLSQRAVDGIFKK